MGLLKQKGNGGFWKDDARRSFLTLKGMHTYEEETRRLPRIECSFYKEYRNALRFLLRLKDRLADIRALSPTAVYQVLVRSGAAKYRLINELGHMR